MRMLIRVALPTLALAAILASNAGAAREIVYKGKLSPAQEVADPPVDSNAKGKAELRFHDAIRCTVSITCEKIDNVISAHLHIGARGVNGPIVATIYNGAGVPTGRINGHLASRTITQNDLAMLPANTIEGLLAELDAGNIYVNVHTTDFPSGEVRGQMKHASGGGGGLGH